MFSKFECSMDFTFTATHHLLHAVDKNGRVPHVHFWRVTVGWNHEANYEKGFTWDADKIEDEIRSFLKTYQSQDLNLMFTQPTAEVLAADILDKIPSYFDWVEVSHRPDWRARLSRRHLSKDWLENYRITK
jgi:6-pyruvoyl-tetrahydropterin synthase